MALYKSHLKFNLIIALPFFLFFLYFFFHVQIKYLITFSAVFVYASYFLSPDVDLSYKNNLFSLKGILTLPFLLYSFIFRHRGISHIPILGTLTRIAYLAVLILITLWLLDLNKTEFWHTLIAYKGFFTSGILAMVLSDLCHLLLDLKIKL
jgi:uncharacterized metal-binding protein